MQSWYSAKLLFECLVNGVRHHDGLCEESVRIFRSDNEVAARLRAAEIGGDAEHWYLNEVGERVEWKLVSVVDVQDLCEQDVSDGMEVFSLLYRRKQV